MKIRVIYLLLLMTAILLPACSQGGPEDSRIVADINGYKLTQAEYLSQLAAELEFDRDFKVTDAAKKEFLEQIIRRELMIQEAQKLKLDRQAKFVRAIERYWESTLIRDLLEARGEQIDKMVVVSQAEVDARYAQMQAAGDQLPPLAQIRQRLVAELRAEKKASKLTQWIDGLRKNAKVKVDQALLLND